MFDKILLPVDGSEPSGRAVDMARELASCLGSEVVVLHVLERLPARSGAMDVETVEEASSVLDSAVAELKDAGVNARGELVRAIYGYEAKAIIEAAELEDARLIVMGTRGLSDLGGLVMGSVAHKVLHLGTRPVLLVR